MSIRKNTAVNLAGAITPIFISIITVPIYLEVLGKERYGVLALVWVFLGYFGLFKMGLNKATANEIAKAKRKAFQEKAQIFWTALVINLMFGVVGALTIYIAGTYFFNDVFKISTSIRQEVVHVLPWLAIAVPVATLTSVLTGALEGVEEFVTVNLIQILGVVLFQIVPLMVALNYNSSLQFVVPAAVLARIGGSVILMYYCFIRIPIKSMDKPNKKLAATLFKFGGWVSISGIISPLMTSADRFLIGSTLGAAAVTIYTIPYNLAMRLLVLPGSLSRALFPRFSKHEREKAEFLALDGVKALNIVITPIIVCSIFFVKPFLVLWVGADLGYKAAPVCIIILIGVWFNALAFIPFSMLQGQGNPKLVAKFHMLEIVPYILALWLFTKQIGIVGAAIAWTMRVIADAGLLFNAAMTERGEIPALIPSMLIVIVSAMVEIYFVNLTSIKISAATFLILTSMLYSWVCTPEVVKNTIKTRIVIFGRMARK